MKKLLILAITLAVILGATPAYAQDPADYGDVTLTGGFQAGHFPDWWDLTQGDLVLSFTYDATGLVDDFGGSAHAWGELGVRSACYGDFNPTWQVGGAGVWLATDYDWNANTFDPDPPGAPTLDLDDKLILQKGGGMDEGDYNLPSAPPNPWANHAVWFDRDGVDQWQAQMWGAIDGVTYNTGGTYDIVITLHATSDTSGEAYMTVNGEPQGFYDPNWHAGPADLMPAGMTFTGDMKHLQVFYGMYGYGATHTVAFEDITADGHLTDPPLAPCFEQAIDIKPGSDPNSINLKSKGVVPVAVLTTDDFDASTVDPGTVLFAGASPVRWTLEDVDSDGDMDMLFHFKTQELDLDAGSTEAYLTGYTQDGQFIWGVDAVNIVPKGK
ncbi:MAG: hypothetical protein Kow0063_11720 [Anaerolineae bacterium]